jgi:uncharacterized protein
MSRYRQILAIVIATWLAGSVLATSERTLSILLLSGSNNHDWKVTTPVLVSILEKAGGTVHVVDDVMAMTPASLSDTQVVVSNFNEFGREDPGPVWGKTMRAAFLQFIQKGGGFVAVHAGSSVFYDWPEFQEICGAWWGPQTSHGAIHESEVVVTAPEHPITAGLGPFRTTDEFWQNASHSPRADVLAVSLPKPGLDTSHEPQPVLLVTTFGHGRGVALLLGHNRAAMENPGFQRLLVRSAEWAANGQVGHSAMLEIPIPNTSAP